MYTLEQINLVVDVATECKLRRGKSIAQSGFAEKLAKRWEPLIDSYFKEVDEDE